MERKRNTLYFEPDERNRFFRAIPLVGRLRKLSQKEMAKTIEHEKAHIRVIESLGYADRIGSYRIKLTEGIFRAYMTSSVLLDKSGIPERDMIKILMAPRDPSRDDRSMATNAQKKLLRAQQEAYSQ